MGENDIVEESYVEFVIDDALKANLKSTECIDENYPDASEKLACEAKYDSLVNDIYTLRGLDTRDSNGDCKSEYDDGNGNCVSPYYEDNQDVIRDVFGTLANDINICSFESSHSYCSVGGLSVDADSNGDVDANDGAWDCFVDNDGNSYCKE